MLKYHRIFVLLLLNLLSISSLKILFTPLVKANAQCNVPASYSLIQLAVDDDTCKIIIVSAGTYLENVVISRNLTIQGESKNNTIVNGNDSDTVFDIQPGSSVTMTNLTIRNGKPTAGPETTGGGIQIYTGTLTLIDALVTNNRADYGAGIYGYASKITIRQSEIISNQATENGGGIAGIFSSTASIENSTVAKNGAGSHGGGIYGGNINIISGTVEGNEAGFGGGALATYKGHITLSQTIISNNIAQRVGGGVFANGSYGGLVTVVVTHSTIISNRAGDGGGILGVSLESFEIGNSEIVSNIAKYDGGGINGSGINITNTTIQGNLANNGGGVFGHSSPVTITNSMISENTGRNSSGGIYISFHGDMTINNTVISDNESDGIKSYEGGHLVINNSTIKDNEESGIEIGHNSGDVDINNSTISGNAGAGGGGGISCSSLNSQVTINNSTLSNNSAVNYGGGIEINGGNMVINNSTIYSNSSMFGSGIYRWSGSSTLTVTSSIIADNNNEDCYGQINSIGNNIASDASCNFSSSGDMNNTNPLLGPLQDNGGPTLTHLPRTGSPAIDAGNSLYCTATDQRGVLRPQDGDVDGNSICDVGSVEFSTVSIYLPYINKPD